MGLTVGLPRKVRYRMTHKPSGITVEGIAYSDHGPGTQLPHQMKRTLLHHLARKLHVRGETGEAERLVRDYSDWTDEDWRKPELALDRAREQERGDDA